MTNQHPITPPPELVQQWIKQCNDPVKPRWQEYEQDIANLAAQWGAEQELEACCRWLPKLPPWSANDLRKHRRPKPPSLKEQALASLAELESPGRCDEPGYESICNIIRRALEQLPDAL